MRALPNRSQMSRSRNGIGRAAVPQRMKIATYNVNGVNGRLPVLLRWLAEAAPDIVCLQELKAPQERFPTPRSATPAMARSGTARRAGTASPSWRAAPTRSRRGAACPAIPTTAHSRYIEAAVDGHAGRLPLSAERQPGARPEVRLQAALVRAAGRHAPPSCSPPAPRSCWPATTTSCRPTSTSTSRSAGSTTRCSGRRCARRSAGWSAQGWTDALRTLHPGERIYTFWDYFRNAYARDAGLRIDHLLLSPALRQAAEGGRRRPRRSAAGRRPATTRRPGLTSRRPGKLTEGRATPMCNEYSSRVDVATVNQDFAAAGIELQRLRGHAEPRGPRQHPDHRYGPDHPHGRGRGGRPGAAALELAGAGRQAGLQLPLRRPRIRHRPLPDHRRRLLRVHRPGGPVEEAQGQVAVHQGRASPGSASPGSGGRPPTSARPSPC